MASDEPVPFPARTDGEGSAICYERDDLYENNHGGSSFMPAIESEKPVGGKVI